MEEKLDARRNAYRSDIAAQSLKGVVYAAKYATGAARQIVSAAAPVRREPLSNAPLDTEALYGERVTVYDESDGWAWGQLEADRYVGWLEVPAAALTRYGVPFDNSAGLQVADRRAFRRPDLGSKTSCCARVV